MTVDILKNFSFQLAKMAESKEGRDYINQMEWLSLMSEQKKPASQNDEDDSNVDRTIGIWDFHEDKLKRNTNHRESWQFWSSIDEIALKKTKKRGVLVGESVARGYFFDPSVSFASLLEKFLNKEKDEFEIVDFAKTDGLVADFVEILDKVEALEPDFLILFMGNNFPNPLEFPVDFAEFMFSGDQPLAFLRQYYKDTIIPQAYAPLIMRIKELSDKMPIHFILPEFNIFRWKHEDHLSFLTIHDFDHVKWQIGLEEAVLHFQKGEFDLSEIKCDELILMDKRQCAPSLKLKGDLRIKKGDFVGASEFFIAAKDVYMGLPVHMSPRCYEPTRSFLKDQLSSTSVSLIDCRELFMIGDPQTHAACFLDYCHLSLKGLEKVANAQAAQILEKACSYKAADSFSDLPNLEAFACLASSVHCLSHGQNSDFVLPLLERIFHERPAVWNYAKKILTFMERPVHRWFSDEYYDCLEAPSLEKYLNPMNTSRGNDKTSYFQFRSCLEQISGENIPLSPSVGPQDLLQTIHWADYRVLVDFFNEEAFQSFFSRTMEFRFIASDKSKKLKFTGRVINELSDKSQSLKVLLNGKVIDNINLSQKWTEKIIECEDLVTGLNHLCLEFPLQKFDRARSLADATNKAKVMKVFNPSPVWGQVYDLFEIS